MLNVRRKEVKYLLNLSIIGLELVISKMHVSFAVESINLSEIATVCMFYQNKVGCLGSGDWLPILAAISVVTSAPTLISYTVWLKFYAAR